MKRRHGVPFVVLIGSLFMPVPASAQGGMRGMPGGMMMGAMHDSATRAMMFGIHDLVLNHDKITRTVTNLPNGVRTVTESDDPRIAALIKEHVAATVARVEKTSDPGLPMESPALRQLFTLGAKIQTTTTATAKGIVVTQTSDDSSATTALQTHAREVSDLVKGGMAAMHAAMMRSGAPR